MELFLLMALRVILLFLPFAVLLFLLIKKRIKLLSIIVVILLLCNSMFMLFSNTYQKNIIDMNSLDINKVTKFFSNIEFNESKINRENIYICDEEDEFNIIADFADITYRKYPAGNDVNNTFADIIKDSTILKQVPQLIQNDSGISFYASDLKCKIGLWNIFYNYPDYDGCIIIECSNEIYYIEYEVKLYGGLVAQVLYKLKFGYKIDVMNLFESPIG